MAFFCFLLFSVVQVFVAYLWSTTTAATLSVGGIKRGSRTRRSFENTSKVGVYRLWAYERSKFDRSI